MKNRTNLGNKFTYLAITVILATVVNFAPAQLVPAVFWNMGNIAPLAPPSGQTGTNLLSVVSSSSIDFIPSLNAPNPMQRDNTVNSTLAPIPGAPNPVVSGSLAGGSNRGYTTNVTFSSAMKANELTYSLDVQGLGVGLFSLEISVQDSFAGLVTAAVTGPLLTPGAWERFQYDLSSVAAFSGLNSITSLSINYFSNTDTRSDYATLLIYIPEPSVVAGVLLLSMLFGLVIFRKFRPKTTPTPHYAAE